MADAWDSDEDGGDVDGDAWSREIDREWGIERER